MRGPDDPRQPLVRRLRGVPLADRLVEEARSSFVAGFTGAALASELGMAVLAIVAAFALRHVDRSG